MVWNTNKCNGYKFWIHSQWNGTDVFSIEDAYEKFSATIWGICSGYILNMI